jgi:hypothetical protein
MNELKVKLTRLRDQVLSGEYGIALDWGGADVVIGPSSRPMPADEGFYPDAQYVATKHHRELSWLFEQLRDLFSPHIDFVNKYEFYGRLADSAISYLEEAEDGEDQNPTSLLVSIIEDCLRFTQRIYIAPGLDELKDLVLMGKIGVARDWGGADVVIGPPPRPVPTVDGFYPDPDYVATKHHRELSWLFEQLRDLFTPYVDFMNKYEFYGRLADSANRFITKSGDDEQTEVLRAVLHEADSMLVEFSTFGDLQPSISREIGTDPLEHLLDNDLDNPEESKRILRELGLES